MSLNIIELPYSYFPDFNRGRPLYNASIYVGIVDTDPEQPINQKPVTLRQEDGTEIPAAQPILTSSGGVPIYNGGAVTILVDGSYSVKVLDNQGAQAYYSPDVMKGVPITEETIPIYTDIVYRSVDDMISGNPIEASEGDSLCTGQSKFTTRTSGGIPLNNGLFARASEIHVKDYDVDSSSSQAEVRAALDRAIADIDLCGGGIVIIASDLQYGYDRVGAGTYPNMKANVNNTQVIDYSFGNSDPAPFEDGSQTRVFYHTPNVYDGFTDGNFQWINGDYHPGLTINNSANLAPPNDPSRTPNDNRRGSIMWCSDGAANWLMGQGVNTGPTFTDNEMEDFRGVINNIPDLSTTGLLKWLQVSRLTTAVAFNTTILTKTTPYEFGIRPGFASGDVLFRGTDINPNIRTIGPSGQVGLRRSAASLELKIDNVDCYKVSTGGTAHRFISTNGNLELFLDAQSTSRRILLSNTTSDIRIQGTNNSTNTLVHNDAGDLAITGSYSPFTGTHIFFSSEKLESGVAVDLVDVKTRKYTTMVDVSKEKLVPVDIESIIREEKAKCEENGEDYGETPTPNESFRTEIITEIVEQENEIFGMVSITSSENSKICAGIVDHQIEIEGGYITYVAACGDNKTPNINGFKTNSSNGVIEAGDILVTSGVPGELMKANDNLPESVVRFKAMSNPDENGITYGYFK